jgi:hypothetical protein
VSPRGGEQAFGEIVTGGRPGEDRGPDGGRQFDEDLLLPRLRIGGPVPQASHLLDHVPEAVDGGVAECGAVGVFAPRRR